MPHPTATRRHPAATAARPYPHQRPNAPRAVPAAPVAPLGPTAPAFDALGLGPATSATIAAMGIADPTPIQARAIPVLLEGRDLIGQARTGSGKTLAFAAPIVERCDPALRAVQAIVLVPTRELAIQVGEVVGRLAAARRLRLTLLYGGRSLVPEARALQGGPQIVVATPGRALDHLRQGNLVLDRVRVFVLDEGDEMLDRGFAPDVERILSRTPSARQTALFSATVPEWVGATAARHLRNPVTLQVDAETPAPPEIEHVVYEIDPAARLAALRTLLDRRGDGPMIVFGRTKHGVKKLAKKLEQLGYSVAALQGNMSQNARERTMAQFRSGAVPILLATNVAARGLDVAGVEQVVNYELPESAELFTHRSGRTGRMGRQGEAITLVTREETPKLRQIERALGRALPRKPWPYGPLPISAERPEPPAYRSRPIYPPRPPRPGFAAPRQQPPSRQSDPRRADAPPDRPVADRPSTDGWRPRRRLGRPFGQPFRRNAS